MSSTVPSLAQMRASLPPEKDRLDSLWLRFVLRKLSFPVTWVFIRLGFSANYVSYLSMLVVFGGTILMSIDDYFARMLGAFLFNFWVLLDCVDGNIARVKQQVNAYGEFADAMSGYIAYAFVFLGMGIAAEHTKPIMPGVMNQMNFVVMGALASICHLTTRLLYKKFVEVTGQPTLGSGTKPNILFTNIGITGLLMPSVLVSAIFGWLHWVTLFYLFCWGGAGAYFVVTKIIAVERSTQL